MRQFLAVLLVVVACQPAPRKLGALERPSAIGAGQGQVLWTYAIDSGIQLVDAGIQLTDAGADAGIQILDAGISTNIQTGVSCISAVDAHTLTTATSNPIDFQQPFAGGEFAYFAAIGAANGTLCMQNGIQPSAWQDAGCQTLDGGVGGYFYVGGPFPPAGPAGPAWAGSTTSPRARGSSQ
jgi:hypothetical protein